MARQSFLYRHYVGSGLWSVRRFLWYWLSNRRCDSCGRWLVLHKRDIALYPPGQATVMTVHHRTYRRLGHEHRADVELLCWPCHKRLQLDRTAWLIEHGKKVA